MDVGQEDWLLRYDDPVDGMHDEISLRADANVSSVELLRGPLQPLYIVKFNTGARAPADEELATRVRARRTRHYRQPTDTEAALIDELRGRYPAGELDLESGSVLRGLISNTAVIINQLQSASVEQAREQIIGRLDVGDVDGVPNDALNTLAEQAMAAQNQGRQDLIREYIDFDSAEGRTNLARTMIAPMRDRLLRERHARLMPIQQIPPGALPVYDRGTNVGKQWATTPANPEATVEVRGRTRWERLLDDSFLD